MITAQFIDSLLSGDGDRTSFIFDNNPEAANYLVSAIARIGSSAPLILSMMNSQDLTRRIFATNLYDKTNTSDVTELTDIELLNYLSHLNDTLSDVPKEFISDAFSVWMTRNVNIVSVLTDPIKADVMQIFADLFNGYKV